MHDIIKMCSFEGTKSTKGASKMRRDLLNAEISQLRDLLPLPSSTRQRLSQLQLMALVCVYVRKSNYFQQAMKHAPATRADAPNLEFLKALSGFLMMLTQGGKLLYISDNAAEYLGHSMEDLLIHGDSVYDIIDKQDHAAVQAELLRGSQVTSSASSSVLSLDEDRLFLCRMNVSRNARRQMRFGDQKVVIVAGHYLSYLPLCSRNEPVFLAHCTPVAMPETRESVVLGATNVFTSVHTLDMKFINLDKIGEFYLGYNRSSLAGVSWYHLIHPENMREAQTKHRLITTSEQDRSCILLLRLQAAGGAWRWVHCVLQVKDGAESCQQTQLGALTGPPPIASGSGSASAGPSSSSSSTTASSSSSSSNGSSSNGSGSGSSSTSSGSTQQPVIVATNQVLGDREAAVLRANSWLYHYYSMQSKLQYGLAYDAHAQRVHAYYPQVMTYQSDPGAAYMNSSALNGTHYHQPYAPAAAHAPYSLTTPSAYAHLQHYHHHYSVRLQHGLDYSRDAAWGYYDTNHTSNATSSSSSSSSATHGHASSASRSSRSSESPTDTKRRSSPSTPSVAHGGVSEGSGGGAGAAAAAAGGGGGVAVATPVAVRAAPAGVHKGASSPELEHLDVPWKASPTQEVPDYPEYSPYITPPYSAATPTKHHVFSFDPNDPRDAHTQHDQHVPSGPADPRDAPWYSHAFVR
ncbi:neuronal PAS domain-containing protein 4A-like isoform X4 [Macrobrachium rosenbergii]|uniref:neuronal PAS domain-containing protein 4A-like isoform X3 n=1 Tax=Macrobrachium rosenbergii TaxID=79674 RepID=UPI0034D63FC5